MRDFLKGPNLFQRALPFIPVRRWAVENLAHNLDKVIDYRRTLLKRVTGDHILIRLLLSINVSLTHSDQKYVWAVGDTGLRVANSLRMTSNLGAGKLFDPGIFYGKGVKECLIVTTDEFDVKKARKHWMDLQPIQVMSHPYNGMSLPILDGGATTASNSLRGRGFATILINLPMLAFQHKCWWEKYNRYQDNPLDITLFFNAYPLANMLRSHFDITLFNQLASLDMGDQVIKQKDPNPFYLNYYDNATERMLRDALDYISQRHLNFDDWLTAVPQVSVKDIHNRIAFPRDSFTTQLEWAFFMSRFNVLKWLLAHNEKIESQYNPDYIVRIRHWMQRLESGRYLNQGLSGKDLKVVNRNIDLYIKPYIDHA